MAQATKQVSPITRALRWFDPRGRTINTIMFILNRITGLGLVLYLCLHLFMLSKLIQGPEAYDSFIALARTPAIMIGEILVVSAVFIHGLNGIRIALISLGVGVRHQKAMMLTFLGVALVASAYFAIRMLSHLF